MDTSPTIILDFGTILLDSVSADSLNTIREKNKYVSILFSRTLHISKIENSEKDACPTILDIGVIEYRKSGIREQYLLKHEMDILDFSIH